MIRTRSRYLRAAGKVIVSTAAAAAIPMGAPVVTSTLLEAVPVGVPAAHADEDIDERASNAFESAADKEKKPMPSTRPPRRS